MSIICAYQLDLEPGSDQTSKQLLDAVRAEVVTYLRTRLKDEQPQFNFSGITESLPAGHELCTHEQFGENHGLATFVWEFPFGEKTAVVKKEVPLNVSELAWQFSYTLACNDRMLQMALRCRVVTHSFILRNVCFHLGEVNPLHKVVVKLVEKWPCSVAGQAISNAVRTLGESDIRDFVDHSLFERKRALPVIAFDRSPPYVTEAFLAAFQMQMLGLGQVVALQDARATSRLTYLVGRELTCMGGVRVYWPGFSGKARSEAHHYYGYSSMQGKLRETIYHLLAGGSVRGFCQGAIIREARAELGGDGQEIRTLSSLTAAEAKVQAALEERDRIQDQCQALQQQIGQLKAETKHALEDMQRSQKDSEAAREAVKPLLAECEEAKKKATGLLAELQAQQKAVDKANRFAQDSRKEVAEIQAQRERIRKERDAALAQVRSLQEELEQLRKVADATAHAEHVEHDQELYAELERAWDQIKRLQEEAAQGRRDMRELEAKVENYEKHWAPFQEGPGESAEQSSDQGVVTEQAFENVADALRAAAAEFADVLTVWDDAWESAEESRYVSPPNVYRALRAIAEVGREYFAVFSGSPALGPLEQAFHRRVPFKYTNFESKTTLGLYGDDRYFRKGQEARLMQRHLTMGGGQTNNCLQVYFDFDDESRRVLIGYCGRHLRYSRNRT